MASKHYTVNKEIELNLRIRINVESLSNYFSLSEEEKVNAIEEIRLALPKDILYLLNTNRNFTNNENLISVDRASMEVKEIIDIDRSES